MLTHLTGMVHSGRQRAGSIYADRKLFSLSKMQDLEIARHEKRKKLLKWSLAPVILMFLIALWFVLPTPLTYKAIINYKHKSYHTARDWLTPLTWTSPQQFVIAFNSGTVDTQLGKYAQAQTELTRALALAPANKRCMVLQNLVYSLDAHGASLLRQGDDQNAATYTDAGTTLKTENPKCFPPKPKLIGGGGGGGGGSGNSSAQQVLTQSQQQQLQQKNEEGQQQLDQGYSPNSANTNNPNVRPW